MMMAALDVYDVRASILKHSPVRLSSRPRSFSVLNEFIDGDCSTKKLVDKTNHKE